MPKYCEKRDSSSPDQVRFSPYNCNSSKKIKKNYGNCENYCCEKEKDQWEEARCPICIDHPHNAVLLICSSHEKGCQPNMCDTSNLLSNCFDQFCKLHSVSPVKSSDGDCNQPNKFVGCGEKGQELVCPLCRGKIIGWIVVESARKFMNEIVRDCALDCCDFSGNYVELEKHAILEHPSERPSHSQVNNEQQREFNPEDDEDELFENEYDSDAEEEELQVMPLRDGDSFFNHIHFGPEDEILTQECSVYSTIKERQLQEEPTRLLQFFEKTRIEI